jgi:hypothetical protein
VKPIIPDFITSQIQIPNYIQNWATDHRADILAKYPESAADVQYVYSEKNGEGWLDYEIIGKARYTWNKSEPRGPFYPVDFGSDERIVSDVRIPQWARDAIEKHKTEFLAEHSDSAFDIHYKFSYNNQGDGVIEYRITSSNGHIWGKTNPWIWSSSKNLTTNYSGDKFYWPSKKQQDLNQYAWEERMKDPVFKSIEAVVYQLGLDFDYDWNNFSGNDKGRVRYENPNTIKAVCDGFADEATKRLLNNKYINYVEKWSYPGHHAWNVLVLKDGRRLYCDSTWYEGNNVKDGIVPYGCSQEPSQLTFDANEFNSFGYSTTPNGGYLKIHNNWPGVTFEVFKK